MPQPNNAPLDWLHADASRTTDARVATEFYGWTNVSWSYRTQKWTGRRKGVTGPRAVPVPYFTTDPAAAHALWMEIRKRYADNSADADICLNKLMHYTSDCRGNAYTAVYWLLWEADFPLTVSRLALGMAAGEKGLTNDSA